MARARDIFLLLSGAIAVMACSTLPEWAAPEGYRIDLSAADVVDVISYRTLVRADFKSERPPPQKSRHADGFSAVTCARITTAPGTMLATKSAESSGGRVLYRAGLANLRFIALMNRDCSWWNPRTSGERTAEVLRHEQIHFALQEIEVRRMNASLPEIEAQLEATDVSQEAAHQMVQQQFDRFLQSLMNDFNARDREFDEECSGGRNPEQEQKWWDRVHAELATPSY